MKLKAKATDTITSGLITSPGSSEGAKATGRFVVECYDKDGKLKWVDDSKNLVVNVGLQYMAGTSLDGSTARITTWYHRESQQFLDSHDGFVMVFEDGGKF